eukprot:556895-Amphidinium_carterae.1
MSALLDFRLAGNKLSGMLGPDALASFPVLQELWLQRNSFAGSLPGQGFCGSMSTVTRLLLAENRFTHQLPHAMHGHTTNLEQLSIHSHRLSATQTKSISTISDLLL